ncbi:hypothetical protein V6N11_047223 [Hibiscus sabdariffa]|uniref:Uncharacterized protein n=1 Tax=Hibiscus sabdariffa TaxID=183260 RepID=A0ABR1ZLH5_9ROSI
MIKDLPSYVTLVFSVPGTLNSSVVLPSSSSSPPPPPSSVLFLPFAKLETGYVQVAETSNLRTVKEEELYGFEAHFTDVWNLCNQSVSHSVSGSELRSLWLFNLWFLPVMDDGELDFSNQEVFSGNNMGDFPSSCSMDSFFDELLNDSHACTHTHTCNPPGPDNSHTHTCFHVHTKIVPASPEDKTASDDTAGSKEKSKKRPLVNQQLLKRLQGQAALEAEVARLKCLLVDIRGRIEGEIGSFPYQKSATTVNPMNVPGAYVMNPCNVQCNDQMYCPHPGVEGRTGEDAALNGQGYGCDLDNYQCFTNNNSAAKELSTGGVGSAGANGNSSGNKRRKATAG